MRLTDSFGRKGVRYRLNKSCGIQIVLRHRQSTMAGTTWSKAIEAAPNDWLLRDARAQGYGETGDYALAAADLQKAGELRGLEESLLHESAAAYLAAGLHAEYRRMCSELIRGFTEPKVIGPSSRELRSWTCVLAPDAVVDFQRVIQLAESAVSEQPKDASSLRTLGAALFRVGRSEQAEKRLRDALVVQDDMPSAWLFLAMTQARQGKPDSARDSFSKAARFMKEQLPKEEVGQWMQRAELNALLREAEALLKGSEN